MTAVECLAREPPPGGPWRPAGPRNHSALVCAAALVVLVTGAQMLILPVAGDVAAKLAGERHLGAHLGALSTVGDQPRAVAPHGDDVDVVCRGAAGILRTAPRRHQMAVRVRTPV